jgi:hypothetical protein
MKANELRIGNLVSRLDLGNGSVRFETVLGIGEKVITTGSLKVVCNYEDLTPIPLTEEWLIEFGFKCKSYGYGKDEWKQWKFNGYSLNGFTCIMSGVELKHVNQLQNLYFALTSEELTIKE